jgi:anti-sigma factor RsiW
MDQAKLREDLVAYVDDELPAAEARTIETWLAGDPDAQELRRILQEDVLALRGLFGAALREPVPAALTAAIGAGSVARTSAAGTVVDLPRRAQPRPVARWLAAAAIAGLAVGGLGGFLGERQQGRQEIAQLQQQFVQTQQQDQQETAQLQQQLVQTQQQGQRETAQLQQQLVQTRQQGQHETAQLQQQLAETQQQAQQEIVQHQQQLAQMQQQGQQEMAQLHVKLDQTQQQLAAAQQPQPWIMQVAQYHKIYAREQRHLVEVPAAETPHIEQWLGKRLDDLAFKVPDLSAFGLTFKGARMLVVNGAPVAQLVYLPADGRAVALCIIHSKKEDKPLTASQQDDLNLVDWRVKGYGFVVLGWENPDELRAIAEASQKGFAL